MSASNLPEFRLTLVRHGEVHADHHGTFYGGADVPLSDVGLAKSLALAEELATSRPDAVVTSPLSRARALAEPLARHAGCPLDVEPRLVELDRGDWTHRHRNDVERTSPGAIARYVADPELHHAPGGESESVLCARVWAALDDLAAARRGERVTVVCHGHVIRVAVRRITGEAAAPSLQSFVPYHGVVVARWVAGGGGEVLERPEPELPEAMRVPRDGR